MRFFSKVLTAVSLVIVLLCGATCRAQEYRGALSGTVADRTGARIPRATIEAKSPQQTYNTKSDAAGHFLIPYVQPATYTITVNAPGFNSMVYNDVILDVAGSVNIPVEMSVRGATDVVEVNTDTFALATTDASVGTVIDQEKVQNLPLNGRQIYMLMSLTPGVRFTTTHFGSGGNSGTRGWDVTNAYTIDGQPGTTNQFMLNGAPISVQGGGPAGTWNISPSVDAVQEFKVMTVTADAQYGRVGGGAMNTIIRQGTPHYHGTLYDFWRNSVLDANTYQQDQVGNPKSFHNQHQFGGTVGGPFIKKRGFFFFSFEGWREVLPAPVITTVPTPDMYPDANGDVNLSGYLAAVKKTNGIYDPQTTVCATNANPCPQYTRSQFPNNTIPAARISPIGLKIMKLYPKPNLPGYQNNYIFNGKDAYHYNMPIARVDYDVSDRTKIYGIFAFWKGSEYRNGNGLSGPATTGNINNSRESWTGVADLTHTITNSLVADVRVSFNRYVNPSPNGALAAGLATLSSTDLGLSMPSIPTTTRNLAPQFTINDGFASLIGNTISPTVFETYDLGPSITHTIGRHSLHYGGEFSLYHDVSGGIGNPNGSFTFSTAFTQQNYQQSKNDGSAIASLLLGIPSSGSVQWQYAPYETYKYFGFFVQDNWRATEKIAINAGLRWDDETSPVERHNHLLAGVCLTCTNPLTTMINFPANNTLPNGATMVNPILGAVQYATSSLPAYNNYTGFLQPKLGISFHPTRDIVFHSAYTVSKAIGIELGGASPYSQTTSYNASPDEGLHPSMSFFNGTPFPNGAQAPPGTSQGALGLVGNGLSIDQRDRKIPIVEQWSFGFQSQLPRGVILDLTYVGAHTYHLRASQQLNGLTASEFAQGHANPAYLNQLVKNPFYGVLPVTTSLGANPTIAAKYLMVPYPQYYGNLYVYTIARGFSHYNSLQAKAEKRISAESSPLGGVSLIGSFTWSKLMSATGYLNNSGLGLVDPNPYYGIDSGDRPWTIAFSGLYNLPFGRGAAFLRNASRPVDLAIGGWQLDWIFNDQGGTPISYPNGYNYNCGTYNIVPQHRSYSSYLNNSNPSCFTSFAPFTAVTQAPRTVVIRNPYAQQTALGLEKKWSITETVKLQFKAEAFNATNTPIFAGPSTGSPNTAISRNASVADPNQPGAWSGYGTISSTEQNFPRQLQLSGKIFF